MGPSVKVANDSVVNGHQTVDRVGPPYIFVFLW